MSPAGKSKLFPKDAVSDASGIPARGPVLRAFSLGLAFAIPGITAVLAPAESELSYPERSVLTLVNAVRLDPPRYGQLFLAAGSSVLASSPALTPLFHDSDLWRAAHAHSEDMATCRRMGHASCDGTAWDVRIKRFLPNAGSYAENVASGQASAIAVMNSWLNSSGHRANILSSRSTRIGCGFSAKGGGAWWTQTFASGGRDPDSVFAGGSHFPSGKEVRFWVNLSRKDRNGGGLKAVQLLIDGETHAMTLALGKAEAGSYEVKLPPVTRCRTYRFLALREGGTGGNVLGVYPRTGSFRTSGEGGCAENWIPQAGSSIGFHPRARSTARLSSAALRLMGIPGPTRILPVHAQTPAKTPAASSSFFDAGGRIWPQPE